jgi:nucleoside-diphosphate-sugar epimerase
MSVRYIAEMVTRISSLDKDDPKSGCPDITCVREVLGWDPRVQPDEGLKIALEWFAVRVI